MYVAGLMNVLFGVSSWVRISSASIPEIRKNSEPVIMYWIPMTLASIEKMYLRMKLVGSGWMWSRTAWYGPVGTPGASVAMCAVVSVTSSRG